MGETNLGNYIDLHSHILPAIDDGPQTMEESVSLARAYVASGYGYVVATPHAGGGRPTPEEIITRLKELQQQLIKNNIPLKILPGAEQHIEPHTLELLKEKKLLTLNGTRYFLLELPFFQPLPPYTEELIFNLTTSGYIPVIPHPERISALLQDPKLIFHLHQAGALFQVTWGALTGLLGPDARSLVLAMFRANLAHFFATDAHHAETRLLNSARAVRVLEEEAIKQEGEQEKGESSGQTTGDGHECLAKYAAGAEEKATVRQKEAGEETGDTSKPAESPLARLYLFDRPRQLLKNRQLDLPPATEPHPEAEQGRSILSRIRRRTGF